MVLPCTYNLYASKSPDEVLAGPIEFEKSSGSAPNIIKRLVCSLLAASYVIIWFARFATFSRILELLEINNSTIPRILEILEIISFYIFGLLEILQI